MRSAYEVRLAPEGGGLIWIERTASGEMRYDAEPQTDWWLRMKVDLLSILPIEWLLSAQRRVRCAAPFVVRVRS